MQDFILELGGNPAALFLQAGLSPADVLNGDNFISWPAACTLLEIAADSLQEPQFGLQWALELPDDFQNSGPLAFLALITPDVRSFMELARHYQKIHCNGFMSVFTEMPEIGLAAWTLHIHPSTPSCRQFSEHIFAAIAQMAYRHFEGFTFDSVWFQHSAPSDLKWYKTVFNCPVHFNSDRLEIRGDIKALDFKLGGSLPILRPLLNIYLDSRIQKTPRSKTPMSDTVKGVLPSTLGANVSNVENVAKALNLSPKKMQRLLKEEDTSFTALKGEVRKDMAHRLLMESDIALSVLAARLDYTSVEAFRTACMRWYGQSPSAYRQRLQQKERR